MFYQVKKKGLTPREMKCGTRTLITFEAAADWRAERELETLTQGRHQGKAGAANSARSNAAARATSNTQEQARTLCPSP